jgi:1-acyl-sn-glycerol-3-phosphate acyltransferase
MLSEYRKRMTLTPEIDAESPDFPGDPTPQTPFGFRDSLRSALLWSAGVPHLAFWMAVVRALARYSDLKETDWVLKLMSRAVPALSGVRIEVRGGASLDPTRAYVYVANHVNIFDMFAIYQAVPQFTRALEHVDHFSWPFIGPLLTAAGQIPVDPENHRTTVAGLKKAAEMIEQGQSITVLPEGSRTLDGSVGPFFAGAFRLAIRAGVPVVPLAIRGGRSVSRRGDWRIRPGKEEVLIGTPIPTESTKLSEAEALAEKCRQTVIDLLQGRAQPDE